MHIARSDGFVWAGRPLNALTPIIINDFGSIRLTMEGAQNFLRLGVIPRICRTTIA